MVFETSGQILKNSALKDSFLVIQAYKSNHLWYSKYENN